MNILNAEQRIQAEERQTGCDAIEVSHLTKVFEVRYRIPLKRRLIDAISNPLGKKPSHEDKGEEANTLSEADGSKRIEENRKLPALNDVSFRVPHGQTTAVIGRNGSGKSTLMGLLARVYKPTSGTIKLSNPQGGKARIAPLLELNSGFHMDLTGEENIEFYGAVLGLNSKQMAAKKQQIIDFAELGKKVFTTIRNWNDGARLRLGFSIAVHIDPDILLVDEVLAVGDEHFQNKCYQLIAQLQNAGKTILFVSHDLAVVERVANRVIWMQSGVIKMDGDVHSVLAAYRADSIRPPD